MRTRSPMMFRRPARMLQSFLRHNSASAPLYHALARQFAIPRRVLAGRVVFEPIPSRPSPPAGADLCLVHGIWLDQNAGADGWAMTLSGERGVQTTRSRSIWPTLPSRVLLWPAVAWFRRCRSHHRRNSEPDFRLDRIEQPRGRRSHCAYRSENHR
jgi:hypothetical protein